MTQRIFHEKELIKLNAWKQKRIQAEEYRFSVLKKNKLKEESDKLDRKLERKLKKIEKTFVLKLKNIERAENGKPLIEKKLNLTYFRDKAKKAFQKFCRLRDSDKEGWGECISCGIRLFWNKGNGGHYIPAKHEYTCFDERNCNLQCVNCNKGKAGNQINYRPNLDIKYGEGTADTLLIESKTILSRTVEDYKTIEGYFLKQCDDLMKTKTFFDY